MGSTHRPKIAILASGSGTTAEAFIRAAVADIARAEIVLVVCNNARAGIFERIRNLNREYGLAIPVLHINGQTHPGGAGKKGQQTLEESAAVCEAIDSAGCALVVLMGYLKEIRGDLLKRFGWQPGSPLATARMINTHPGPLPHTAARYGLGIQRHVLDSGLGYSAHTVHAVSAGYDTGKIIAEHRVAVRPADTPEKLFARVQAAEKHHLPRDIHAFLHAGASAYAGV